MLLKMMRNWIRLFHFSRKNETMVGFNTFVRSLCLFIVLMVFLIPQSLEAQDTLQAKKITRPVEQKQKKQKRKKKTIGYRSPKKAMLMALMPGLGQIYNHKYWKVPIVYTGFAVLGYFIVTNTHEYHIFRDAYNATADTATTNPYAKKYSAKQLQVVRDYYRRNMQLSYILTGAWYILQIVDANVDAHLTHWNISNNLSLEVEPVINPPIRRRALGAYNGVTVRMRF